jgi:16S rRNA (cytosine967-C5)-methyltransferase
VVRFLAPGPDDVIYDACGSPGGKSIALGRNGRFVVAADRSRPKVRRLAENVARAGGARVVVIRADVTRPPIRHADAVLLDVPCLGTGTLGRNPDARWRVSAAGLAQLAEQAAGFLASAAEVVRPGGLLLFSTCSLESEENEAQIDRFLAADPRFHREPNATVPEELLTAAGDLFLLPQQHGTDGAYAARLRRRAS